MKSRLMFAMIMTSSVALATPKVEKTPKHPGRELKACRILENGILRTGGANSVDVEIPVLGKNAVSFQCREKNSIIITRDGRLIKAPGTNGTGKTVQMKVHDENNIFGAVKGNVAIMVTDQGNLYSINVDDGTIIPFKIAKKGSEIIHFEDREDKVVVVMRNGGIVTYSDGSLGKVNIGLEKEYGKLSAVAYNKNDFYGITEKGWLVKKIDDETLGIKIKLRPPYGIRPFGKQIVIKGKDGKGREAEAIVTWGNEVFVSYPGSD